MFPGVPRLNAAGLINADIATNTATKPTNYENQQLTLALQSLVYDKL